MLCFHKFHFYTMIKDRYCGKLLGLYCRSELMSTCWACPLVFRNYILCIYYMMVLVWKISDFLNPVCNKSPPILCLEDYSTKPADVPQTHKRAVCDLTVADRLALYDHVIQEALQQSTKASSNEDLYVDLVSKLNKGEFTTPCSWYLLSFVVIFFFFF